jgi:hypothetical protein
LSDFRVGQIKIRRIVIHFKLEEICVRHQFYHLTVKIQAPFYMETELAQQVVGVVETAVEQSAVIPLEHVIETVSVQATEQIVAQALEEVAEQAISEVVVEQFLTEAVAVSEQLIETAVEQITEQAVIQTEAIIVDQIIQESSEVITEQLVEQSSSVIEPTIDLLAENVTDYNDALAEYGNVLLMNINEYWTFIYSELLERVKDFGTERISFILTAIFAGLVLLYFIRKHKWTVSFLALLWVGWLGWNWHIK